MLHTDWLREPVLQSLRGLGTGSWDGDLVRGSRDGEFECHAALVRTRRFTCTYYRQACGQKTSTWLSSPPNHPKRGEHLKSLQPTGHKGVMSQV